MRPALGAGPDTRPEWYGAYPLADDGGPQPNQLSIDIGYGTVI